MKRAWSVSTASYDGGAPHPPPPGCPGVGRRVPYYDVKGGRAPCPVCGYVGAVLDDRDGSVFTFAEDHNEKKEQSK